MNGLTFGEQVKIILSRKGMTIKELAETIEERTGKAMSRQNLTQRLGRDNFQEQDMRMIASILGCPFNLSIFPDESSAVKEEYSSLSALSAEEKKPQKKKQKKALNERDITLGELYDIHQEMDELERMVQEEGISVGESIGEEAVQESVQTVQTAPEAQDMDEPPAAEDEAAEIIAADMRQEETPSTEERVAEEPEKGKDLISDDTGRTEESAFGEMETLRSDDSEEWDDPEVLEEPDEAEEEEIAEEPVEEKQSRKELFRTGGIFLRRKGVSLEEEDKKQSRKYANKEVKKETKKFSTGRRSTKEIIPPDKKDFEPIIQRMDEEEDLTLGEMNPYTGREYQTNSVRVHPARIGYVQVYDRAQHGWTDMTEWAFIGYQERKKALLGRDYEPPIYLD